MHHQNASLSVLDPSPVFAARLALALPELADRLDPSAWNATAFTTSFPLLLDRLRAVCQAAAQINLLILGYQQRVLTGTALNFSTSNLTLRETMDTPLSAAFAELLDQTNACLHEDFVPLIQSAFGLNLTCLLDPGLSPEELPALDHALRAYLLACHSAWLADLILLRTAWQRGWRLAPITSFMDVGVFHIRLPLVNKQPLNLFCRQLANRLCFICEETFTTLLAEEGGFSVTLIPAEQRDPALPRRFKLHEPGVSEHIWQPEYQEGFDFL